MSHRLAHRLRWPLPALLAWALGWALFIGLRGAQWPDGAALLAAALGPAGLGLLVDGRWRRLLVAAGFPVSLLVVHAAGSLPPWAWLLPLALLLLLYPVQAWRDAPLFPTPASALDGLERDLVLAPAARILDAGCGLGHGLQALRRVWPQARLEGLEHSMLLVWAARLRCPWAGVARADMWAASWSGHDLVYLFQRPESMARAWAKACAELAPGSWLVSLEFAVPGVAPQATLSRAGQRPVWAYRTAGPAAADPALESTKGRSRVDSTPAGGLTRSGRYGGPKSRRARADMGHRARKPRAACPPE